VRPTESPKAETRGESAAAAEGHRDYCCTPLTWRYTLALHLRLANDGGLSSRVIAKITWGGAEVAFAAAGVKRRAIAITERVALKIPIGGTLLTFSTIRFRLFYSLRNLRVEVYCISSGDH
jgi:hypothetical protein